MNSKIYIAPQTNIVAMATSDNLAQFIVTSHSIAEDAGEAKRVFFEDEEDIQEKDWENHSLWND